MCFVSSDIHGEKRLYLGVETVIVGAATAIVCGHPKLGSSALAYSGEGGIMDGRTRCSPGGAIGATPNTPYVGSTGVGKACGTECSEVRRFIPCVIVQKRCAAS